MQGQCVVAVYNSRNDAEQAYRAVVGSGVPSDHVRLSNQQPSQVSSSERVDASSGGESIWDWLFGSDVPENERRVYEGHMAKGGAALSVLVDSPSTGRPRPYRRSTTAVQSCRDSRRKQR